MAATATVREFVPDTLHISAVRTNLGEPQPSTAGDSCQGEVAPNGVRLNRSSPTCLMTFPRALSACVA
jgi:hypothetical protein